MKHIYKGKRKNRYVRWRIILCPGSLKMEDGLKTCRKFLNVHGIKRKNKSKYYQMDGKTPLGTIDNDATVKQLYILAECYQVTKDDDVKQAINKGLNFLVEMQYDLGGFPQVYPVQDSTPFII